jgi:hypothetical protein
MGVWDGMGEVNMISNISLVLNNLFLKLVQSCQHYHIVGLYTKSAYNQVRLETFKIFPVYPIRIAQHKVIFDN